MSLSKARVVPTALLAKRDGRRAPDENREIGLNLLGDAGGFAHAVSRNQVSASLQLQTKAASPEHLYELGLTTAAMGFHTASIEALGDCTVKAPSHGAAWRKLAELLRLAGDDSRANAADIMAERAGVGAAKWKPGRDERTAGRLEKAELGLREILAGKTTEDAMVALRHRLLEEPLDAAAMRLLAQMEAVSGDEITCMRVQERALDICPDYVGVRQDYTEVLVHRLAFPSAAPHTARLVASEPDNAVYRERHAHVLMNIGEIDAALEIQNGLLREDPGEARYWLAYARAMHFVHRQDECVQAVRQCLALRPEMGEAYFLLSNLKGKHCNDADIAAIRTHLAGNTLRPNGRVQMLFALGQALEQRGEFAAGFAAYDEGVRLAIVNSRRREELGGDEPAVWADDQQIQLDGLDANDVSDVAGAVRRRKTVFSPENFRTRLVPAFRTANSDTPIFIVGLPRAGSTLTEQILASHSQVEGTRELPLMGDITRDLAMSRLLVTPDVYPECVLDLNRKQLAAIGEHFIERSRPYRKTGRTWFIDKRPWNWLEVGLIYLILPQAKIIDVRREPMAACFANFKQLITKFHHDLDGLGRYYNNYVSLMEHWESVLPGRVHFVQYEQLVENTEDEIRRMLDYCGLPFEEECLRFWETDRAVATPSAQQVRRPIYRDALQQWRNFEPWLGPLKEALARPADA